MLLSSETFYIVLTLCAVGAALAVTGLLITAAVHARNLAVKALCGMSALLVAGGGLFSGFVIVVLLLISMTCVPDAYCPLA